MLYGEIPEPRESGRLPNQPGERGGTSFIRGADEFDLEGSLPMSQQINDCRGITLGSETLVLFGSDVVIGSLKEDVEIPLLANVKRRHARLVRTQTDYAIAPIDSAELSVNGQRDR